MLAAYACEFSSEPEAYSLVIESGLVIDTSNIEMYRELPGLGSAVMLGGIEVAAGNEKFMSKLGVNVPSIDEDGIYVHVCAGKKYAGYIKMAEPAKPAGAEAVDALHAAGVDRVILITEEKREQAKNIADKLGIDEVWPGIAPEHLTEKLKNLQAMQLEGELMAYTGTGSGDLEVMKLSDVGISLGSQYKYTGGDVLIPDGSYLKISKAIKRSRQVRNNIRRSIVLAAAFKAISIVLAISGIFGIWFSAVIDAVSAVVIVNLSDKEKN